MAKTAWKSAASVVSLGGGTSGISWNNFANTMASDNTYGTIAITGGKSGKSDECLSYDFGFTASDVPAGAIITAVNFRVEGYTALGASGVTHRINKMFSKHVGCNCSSSDSESRKGTLTNL